MSQMNVRNVLVDSVGGMFFQQVATRPRATWCLAISSKAYSPDVVQVVRESAQRGVPVIAVTDSPSAPSPSTPMSASKCSRHRCRCSDRSRSR